MNSVVNNIVDLHHEYIVIKVGSTYGNIGIFYDTDSIIIDSFQTSEQAKQAAKWLRSNYDGHFYKKRFSKQLKRAIQLKNEGN
jgi:hypothetical protein